MPGVQKKGQAERAQTQFEANTHTQMMVSAKEIVQSRNKKRTNKMRLQKLNEERSESDAKKWEIN